MEKEQIKNDQKKNEITDPTSEIEMENKSFFTIIFISQTKSF